MKALFILFSILFISCGSEVSLNPENFGGIGNFITQDESLVLSESEKSSLNQICNALSAKSSYFRALVVNNTFSATYSQGIGNCGADVASSDVSLEIALSNGDLEFQPNGGADPIFKNVETDSNGSLKDYCDAVDEDSVTTQMQMGQALMVISVFGANSSQCSGNDVTCAIVEYAFKDDGDRYRIEQAVKITVNTDEADRYKGMVTKKEFIQVCASNTSEKTKKVMSLKSID